MLPSLSLPSGTAVISMVCCPWSTRPTIGRRTPHQYFPLRLRGRSRRHNRGDGGNARCRGGLRAVSASSWQELRYFNHKVMPGSELAARSACVFLGHDQHALVRPRLQRQGTRLPSMSGTIPQPMLCCRVYDPRLCRYAAPFAPMSPSHEQAGVLQLVHRVICQPSAESTAVVIASVLSLPGKAPMPRAVVASIAAMTLQAAVFSPR